MQYLFFLVLCTLSTLSFHIPVRLLCTYPPTLLRRYNILPYYPHPVTLSTALIVSSCTKLFPILLIVWEYDLPSAATAVSWAVIVNNVAALEILMDCGYVRAAILAFIGAGCRAMVEWALLNLIGLQDKSASDLGTGMVGDMLEQVRSWAQNSL
jgi:lipid intermediate transporter